MFKKMKLVKEIKQLVKQIEDIELKRSRSQSELVMAILEHREPDETDAEFFNIYTGQINEIREKLSEKKLELKKM